MHRIIIPALLAILLAAACTPGGPQVTLRGHAVAGPVCPVEQDPPDPACAPRPVANAEVVIRDAGGAEVARVRTDASGDFQVSLAPGVYQLEAQPANGLMGTPAPVTVEIRAGTDPPAIELAYDTGIR